MIDVASLHDAQDQMTRAVGVITTITRGASPVYVDLARWDPRRSSGSFDAANASTDLQSSWIVTLLSYAHSLGVTVGDQVKNAGGRTARVVRVAGDDDGWLIPELLVNAEEVSSSATMLVLSRRDTGGVVSQLEAQAFVVALQGTSPNGRTGGSATFDTVINGEVAEVPATLRSVSPTADILPSDRFLFEGHWGRVVTVRPTSDGSAIEATAIVNWGSR